MTVAFASSCCSQFHRVLKSFHIYTDASDYAYGAILTQEYEAELCPIAWPGRKMNSAEENYYTLEKELGAIWNSRQTKINAFQMWQLKKRPSWQSLDFLHDQESKKEGKRIKNV